MKDVNLSQIYMHLMTFYGVTKFRVFSVLDDKGIYPIETKVEFYYDTYSLIN
jgi:hypothetical protein